MQVHQSSGFCSAQDGLGNAVLYGVAWEATGLPLRYEGEGLRLRALNVDANASLGDGAFALPFVPPASPPGFDAPASLRRFVEGELAELAPLLHPGLRPFAST